MAAGQYGLIGGSLAHSHSPQIHGLLAGYQYALYETAPEDLRDAVNNPAVDGLNVTIPYKRAVIPFCDVLSPLAARIGSVNTLTYDKGRRITGHNTDYHGFRAMMGMAGLDFRGKKVLILGSGATAGTAACAMQDAGAAEIIIVSRSGVHNYDNITCHADAQVMVNTTPVGMYPDIGSSPVSIADFPALQCVLDVVYNPLRTQLMQQATARGIPAVGGLSMLVWQAAYAAHLFTGERAPMEKALAVLQSMQSGLENIVLIGMPGSGKTTVGRALAEAMERPFADMDETLFAQTGRTAASIITDEGEEVFRRLERKVVAGMAPLQGYVIATGGGTILDARNVDALKQNGRLIHLDRALSSLAVKGRPLSSDLRAMAALRMPLYGAASDSMVSNNGTVGEAVKAIIREVYPCEF